jgi:glucokinase
MPNILGIDIGGTKCAIILGCVTAKDKPVIRDKVVFPTEVSKGVNHTLNLIDEHIGRILAQNKQPLSEMTGFGISCGGPLDSKRGLILAPPNLIGWDNIDIVARLEQKWGVKTRLQNDANAGALAEWRFGAGVGCQNMIFLTFGTGMGAGLILNGRLYCGTNDLAGEIGHVRLAEFGPVGYGKTGSFEGFCSGGGLAQLAKTKVLEKLQRGEPVSFCAGVDQLGSLTAKTVAEAAQNGDVLAVEIFRICGVFLGRGLAILIDLLNPERIVIGSVFARNQELLCTAMYEVLGQESLAAAQRVCRIVPAELGEVIGDYAALATAMDD